MAEIYHLHPIAVPINYSSTCTVRSADYETLYVPVTVHREQSVERQKKTNKMQQLDVYY